MTIINPSPLPYQSLEDVRSLANIKFDHESCGYIFKDGEATIVENISEQPKRSFKISAQDHLAAMKRGDIAAIWHTHTDSSGFSAADIKAARQLKIPYLLYSIGCDRFHWFDPTERKPLIGRVWKNPETNCGTLVADYLYQKHGIEVEFIEVDETRLQDPTYSPVYEHIERVGFKILPFSPRDLRNDDLVVFKAGTANPMHLGVITDINRNQFLHHPRNGLSRYDMLDGYWLKCACNIFRWKEWTQ